MTKNKAIEILNKEYDSILLYKSLIRGIDDDAEGAIDDRLIALLTAIDALESAT